VTQRGETVRGLPRAELQVFHPPPHSRITDFAKTGTRSNAVLPVLSPSACALGAFCGITRLCNPRPASRGTRVSLDFGTARSHPARSTSPLPQQQCGWLEGGWEWRSVIITLFVELRVEVGFYGMRFLGAKTNRRTPPSQRADRRRYSQSRWFAPSRGSKQLDAALLFMGWPWNIEFIGRSGDTRTQWRRVLARIRGSTQKPTRF